MDNTKFIEITSEEIKEKIIYLHCATCEKEDQSTEILQSIKKIEQFGSRDESYFDYFERNQILKCNGCETIYFRKVEWNSEDIDCEHLANGQVVHDFNTIETIYPAVKKGRKPIKDFYLLPQQLQKIYNETSVALNANQAILTGMGIRAILETTCKNKNAVGDNLKDKIDNLVTLGVLSKNGSDLLHKLRTLGNASAHEVKPHSNEQLSLALEVLDNLLLNVYVLEYHSKTAFP